MSIEASPGVSSSSPPTEAERLDLLAINTIRMLSADGVQQARSGHPGLPMGAAAMAYVLWTRHLRLNPADPGWANRDRFVLSAGHGSMLLYSLLHLTGHDLPLEQLKNFRQWGSHTPGHPEYRETAGVETTTGPLGQGFGNAVGMALAEARLAAEFNLDGHTIVDHWTYAIASDGDLMEGVHAEAASLAGHLRLGKLTVLYDDNGITIDGETSLAFSEDVAARFAAYGWHVQTVVDGNDVGAIDRAIQVAGEDPRPSLIAVKTQIGFGSPNKQNSSSAHGEPLGDEELALTKSNLGWPEEPAFHIPVEVAEHFSGLAERGRSLQESWESSYRAYAQALPEAAGELRRRLDGGLPADWQESLPRFEPDDGPLATRAASGKALNGAALVLPELMGGSADLAPSNKTEISGSGDFSADARFHRNIRFGVREHGMGAVLNGMSLHGGLRPYGGTFLIFSDYMRPAVRLAALMRQPVIYVYTHDSIGLGEDGPTHQPVEHLAALRAIPGLLVLRPADANETAAAWRVAIESRDRPTALVLTRQKLRVFANSQDHSLLGRGGYVFEAEAGDEPDLVLIASGSEVGLIIDAGARLAAEGVSVRVVSLPSWELFEEQTPEYRDSVLPPTVTSRLAVEAGVSLGWERYVGDAGDVIAIDRFGASAPGAVNMEKFGFHVDNVVARAKALIGR